jgi:signal transduction histidine kinase
MKFSIRSRLLVVAVLGAITCLLSLYALARPFAVANRQRLERAKDSVEHEVERVRDARAPRASNGMRSGRVDRGASFDDVDPPLWHDAPGALREAVAESAASGEVVLLERPVAEGTLFVGAAPLDAGGFAWAATVMTPPRWTPILRIVGVLLGLTSLALVLASLHAISSVERGATGLKASLAALSKDLGAPVPRPSVRELSEVADGIASLASELARAQAALADRERLALLGRVTAGLAHELRNPLASIKLQVDLACRRPDASPAVVDKLKDVVEEIARLDRLVNDLLTVAVRRTGPRQDTDVADLVRRRADLLQPLANDRRVRVEVRGHARTAIDRDAVARVIDNLVRNAIEASPEGARVGIEVTNGSAQTLLRVSDEGAGVPEEHRAELFEPFFTTKAGGVGLGLALARAVAMAHGGTLRYARQGATTVFELCLPEVQKP